MPILANMCKKEKQRKFNHWNVEPRVRKFERDWCGIIGHTALRSVQLAWLRKFVVHESSGLKADSGPCLFQALHTFKGSRTMAASRPITGQQLV